MDKKQREDSQKGELNQQKHEKFIHYADGTSLEEINNTVAIPKNAGFWRTLMAFMGPGALVAVGYMDPGNWITSIAGGAQYAYTLISVILISNLIAMLLQAMAARLGIVTGMDLAQMTRAKAGKKMGIFLWIVTELAIMATDIAEIIGSAIALELIFNIPLLWGVLITAFDVLLLLLLMKLGFRKIEAIVATLVAVILFVFLYEVILAQPNMGDVMRGFVPSTRIVTNQKMLFLALGIVGATVMPHNLYLHSSIAQARQYDRDDYAEKKKAIKFTVIDSNIQLTVAFIVNCLLLVLGAAMFFGTNSDLGRFVDLFNALQNKEIVGSIASPMLSLLFAVALLASGQNSTITGTLSGQIVMEGFVRMKIPLWARRVITRGLSILPVIIFTVYYHGNEAQVENLLIYSQVFLSVALPVSMIPLTMFTSDEKIMGPFVNRPWVKYTAWFVTIVLTLLNIYLILQTIGLVG